MNISQMNVMFTIWKYHKVLKSILLIMKRLFSIIIFVITNCVSRSRLVVESSCSCRCESQGYALEWNGNCWGYLSLTSISISPRWGTQNCTPCPLELDLAIWLVWPTERSGGDACPLQVEALDSWWVTCPLSLPTTVTSIVPGGEVCQPASWSESHVEPNP